MKILQLIIFVSLALDVSAQSKSYTVVFLHKKAESAKVDSATTQELMEGHMTNIRRLGKEGKLLVAGPFDGGGGLFIFNTTSPEEAESWVNTDPAVQAQRWRVEILPYTPRIGSVCPVKGAVDMVSYTFVRFDAIVDKFTASRYPNIIRQHETFVKKVTHPSDMVTEAIFGPNEGGILIVKTELPPDAFFDDPGVQQGLLDIDIKKIYIAKGSFCEN